MNDPPLSGPALAPESGAPDRLVVLLHGYGANGEDLIGLGAHWRSVLAQAMFVAPNAPHQCAINPGGFEWFDLSEPDLNRVPSLAAAARPPLNRFLQAIWEQTGLKPADTVLAGFSQGAMMALEVGLRLATPVSGIIGFSAALPGTATIGEEIASRPPVCLVHGDADEVVPYAYGRAARKRLEELGVEVEFHTSPGAGHMIAEDGLAAATSFLARVAGAAAGSES